ncbi:MAG TPA: UvrD-helicase domain-containing protein, partial [Aggregicoccus sp.]|nr:UvrD-helicase domain-containing protein [Aggregicoccus sp.]
MTSPRYEKPAILAQIPRDRAAVIEASAGTGKTFTLEHLVVDLILETDTRIEEVLVVTFTERATAELRRRVREKLEELLNHTGQAEGVPDAQCWTLGLEARRRIQAALTSLDAATISTIHGFCQRVLSEQAFHNGRLFGEKQVDARSAFSAAFLDELRSRFAREPELKDMVRLWLASGQSIEDLEELLYRCATERGELRPHFTAEGFLAVMKDCPLRPDVLPFISKEMEVQKVNASTRKTLASALAELTEWCERVRGRTDAVPLLFELEEALAARKKYFEERLPALEGAYCRRVWAWLQAVRAQASSPKAALVHAMLPAVRERLVQRKRELGLFDFDDMLTLVRDSLRGPRGESLAAVLRNRYRYALVDEFQDTDEVQWEVFRRLFHESGGKSVLYVIGDPKQAIYSFRGADVQTYLAACKAVEDGGGAVVRLDRNFRSTEAVISSVNRILDQGAKEPFFSGTIGYPYPVSCGKKDFVSVGPDGGPAAPVHLWHFVDEGKLSAEGIRNALGQKLAEEIRGLLDPVAPPLKLRDS